MSHTQVQFKNINEIRQTYDLHPIQNDTDVVSSSKIKKFGNRDPRKYSNDKSKSPVREFISKLSRGIMLPIAMLPVAGLFLGIGSAIVTNAGSEGLRIFGQILQVTGNAVFGNLPVLFCIAIAIAFAEDSGVAALSAFVGWIVFCAFQSALIIHNDGSDVWKFLFYKFDQTEYESIFTANVGIQSLQTSVFGGIIVGYLVALLYRKFKNIQLPQVLGFFSGVRFIPIITFVSMLVVSLVFCIVWPMVGIGLYKMGGALSKTPYGFNSLIFGYCERALVPFGLHHAFYAPLWYTTAGGSIDISENHELPKAIIDGIVNGQSCHSWKQLVDALGITGYSGTVGGDQSCWMLASMIAGTKVHMTDGSVVTITFDMIDKANNCNVGQYMQGKYSFMIFGLPAAAAAITMAAPKGDARKLAFSTVAGAALTSFLTGITEPIEFTFLFLAPALYYGFHAVFCAISFWLMNLFGAHVGMTFSGGAIDFVVYGVIPDAQGAHANCYWAVIIGAAYLPIYYFGFYAIIKHWDIKTPGREGGITRLMTKKDYLAKKAGTDTTNTNTNPKAASVDMSKLGTLDKDHKWALDVIQAYGGSNNLKNVDACITKLRCQIVDKKLVDEASLKALGARGIVHPSNESVYAVFGTNADYLKNLMNELLKKLRS